MIINMQYPHDLSNQKFDGKTHEIIPTSLIKINGNNDFYVLSYYDRNLDKKMETLLREKDNKFYKVPLNNYSQFMFLKFKISGRKCQLSKLPNFIQCENIKSLSEIKKIINNPGYKQKKAVVIYFNEFDKNYYYAIAF